MPMRTAAVAKKTAAAVCQLGLIQRLSSHQSKTVAAEPQLPGPGRSSPVPKKVATSFDQSGAFRDQQQAEEDDGWAFWSDSVLIGIVRDSP